MYARQLTKSELIQHGITEVTTDGHVFRDGVEIKPVKNAKGYLMFHIYDVDEEGNRIKVYRNGNKKKYNYKYRSLGLHRIMWAWHSPEKMVPSGMVVDHINNKHYELEDYRMENLQLLTPRENVNKDRLNEDWHVWELKCRLDVPRSFYEKKLEGFEMAYEQAKADKDDKAAHNLRGNISHTRARLRYYDAHIEEVNIPVPVNQDAEIMRLKRYHERAAKIRDLRAEVASAHKYYQEVKEAYGKDDSYTKKLWGEWKMAIAKLHAFRAENPYGA